MKRLLLAAAAVLAVAAPTAALAQDPYDYGGRYDPYYDDRGDYGRRYYEDRDYGDRYDRRYYGDRYDRRHDNGRWERHRAWRRGDYLPRALRRHWINPRDYGLWRPRDRNVAWFRVGDQLVLANIHNGLVAEARWR